MPANSRWDLIQRLKGYTGSRIFIGGCDDSGDKRKTAEPTDKLKILTPTWHGFGDKQE